MGGLNCNVKVLKTKIMKEESFKKAVPILDRLNVLREKRDNMVKMDVMWIGYGSCTMDFVEEEHPTIVVEIRNIVLKSLDASIAFWQDELERL
jgi:hypothetical protein